MARHYYDHLGVCFTIHQHYLLVKNSSYLKLFALLAFAFVIVVLAAAVVIVPCPIPFSISVTPHVTRKRYPDRAIMTKNVKEQHFYFSKLLVVKRVQRS